MRCWFDSNGSLCVGIDGDLELFALKKLLEGNPGVFERKVHGELFGLTVKNSDRESALEKEL